LSRGISVDGIPLGDGHGIHVSREEGRLVRFETSDGSWAERRLAAGPVLVWLTEYSGVGGYIKLRQLPPEALVRVVEDGVTWEFQRGTGQRIVTRPPLR
jgi:hypothetical protein